MFVTWAPGPSKSWLSLVQTPVSQSARVQCPLDSSRFPLPSAFHSLQVHLRSAPTRSWTGDLSLHHVQLTHLKSFMIFSSRSAWGVVVVVLKRCHLTGFCYPPSTPSLSPSLPFLNLPQDPSPCPTQGILPTCRRSLFLSFQHTQVPQACLPYKYSTLPEGNSDEFNFSTPMH